MKTWSRAVRLDERAIRASCSSTSWRVSSWSIG
jgi:hypothetical protein